MKTTRPAPRSSRRSLLWLSGSLALAAVSCSKSTPEAAPAGSATPAAAPQSAPPASTLTAGFIYVGPKDDYGYNQDHAEGAKTLTALGVKIREEEKVPETVDVQKPWRDDQLDGAKLLFPTSFGYSIRTS